jgi:hypothetical protein
MAVLEFHGRRGAVGDNTVATPTADRLVPSVRDFRSHTRYELYHCFVGLALVRGGRFHRPHAIISCLRDLNPVWQAPPLSRTRDPGPSHINACPVMLTTVPEGPNNG